MCNFMSGKSKARSRTGTRYFDEFRTHFWERSEDKFDRVRSINTFNQRRSRGSGNITPIPSTRDVERELRSSERRLSRSPSISRSQSPPISRRQSPSVSRRQSLPVRERRSELPPVSLLTNDDYMDISFDTGHIERNVESLTLQPPSYDTTISQESSNAGGNLQ
ncbi:unnamed protein product [Rhizophagus irregularis]|nr:unnamed protein product [Rhizophagus irregularis]